MKILIIEDNRDLAFTVRDELSVSYIVDVCHSGEEAFKQIDENQYDLILIDIVLPDISGITLCRRIRKEGVKAAILMLTGKTDVTSIVRALNAGADDYLKKPFAFSELFARIKALLRRPTKNIVPKTLSFADLTLDLSTKKVRRKGKLIYLRKKEFYLLEYLMRNKGIIVSRSMIMESVWESTSQPERTNTVNVHMKSLRDRIDKNFKHKLIKTVPGSGYVLEK
jgi:DNA-binding response OmpR family regulator